MVARWIAVLLLFLIWASLGRTNELLTVIASQLSQVQVKKGFGI